MEGSRRGDAGLGLATAEGWCKGLVGVIRGWTEGYLGGGAGSDLGGWVAGVTVQGS